MELLQKSQVYEVKEESISPFELQKADELFITNTISGIIPVYKYRKKMDYFTRRSVDKFLDLNDDLKEAYHFQQRLYRVYKVKGYKRAKKSLIALLDDMARSKQKRIISYS